MNLPVRLDSAQRDRAAGTLVGLAAGDALGAGYEFGDPLPEAAPVGMIGGGPFGFAPAEWTDDTSMAVVVARALLPASCSNPARPETEDDAGALLPDDARLSAMVDGWRDWAQDAKDVGAQTRAVLGRAGRLVGTAGPSGEVTPAQAARTAAREHHEANGRSAGNGSLMRTAPLAVAFLHDEAAAWDAAMHVSELTHFESDAGEACALWTVAIRHAVLTGELDVRRGLPRLAKDRAALWASRIDAAEQSAPRDFTNNGWVVEAFQGAWSAIASITRGKADANASPGVEPGIAATAPDTTSLRRGIEAAVRGGRDTDTVAAIAGSLLGAAHGHSAIPSGWLNDLHGWPGLKANDLAELGLALATREGIKQES
ncbi:hypothetical protein NCCP1664_20930 [Zafaria cholistanensis]|uniref:ADP-ribosylglycohydrolase n=1 Tax=Zafaria cholistanensis TaxID=1682741 RepID=A0A5A7NUQ3_9MICC|nr:ADP-ribosylglycohydrolase family protein [Zafaria cholistanensis]GER23598.1 hypothetical protein NCCP1664_20930 [Zafaria cholistanensis]